MLRKILLPTILMILAVGFWNSADFKEIAAGVAIFLFGMLSLEQGFNLFTGGTLEKILRKSTSSLGRSLGFGVVSTTIMQSSSLVSVITISFLSAGLITLAAGIGIIFGANLGTTTGAWLVAGFGLKVKISAYAMPMLVFGIILILQKARAMNGIGYILAGMGFLFLGIHHMKEGFEAFKETIDLAEFAVAGYPGLFLFASIGIFATVVMQPSHATLVLIVTALAAGQITYDNALALAIGANIGTTITAILGSLSANEQGKRLAGAHLVFNVVTGMIAIVFIYPLIFVVDGVSEAVGIAADDYTLKLAVFHTIFNLIGIVVMLPFINHLVRFFEGFIKAQKQDIDEPKFLNSAAIDFPDTALQAVRQESVHVYDNAMGIIAAGLGFSKEEILSGRDIAEIAKKQTRFPEYDVDVAYERSVKGIYSAIIAFISKVSFSWQMEQSGGLHWLREANQNVVEVVKDIKHLQVNMMRYLNSDNQEIRTAYNGLRAQIISIVREIEDMRESDRQEVELLSLDALKMVVDDSHAELNTELSTLIREGQITPEMGSSLLNDSTYATDVSLNLIKASQTLFVVQDTELTEAQESFSLDEDEMDEVAHAQSE
ncbi:MAG: Na/Pi symporter [Pseudomonadales bacterium]|jgi:phosphate:Na+ symporter|nr:Na/Pi symporter [Pseudomonadales bacterium]MDP7594007.1 Na/Pi symporter [Pseudomonadales bacterium]HJN48837.1 Na/Pi symporter [Pseudomonadales bacterium]